MAPINLNLPGVAPRRRNMPASDVVIAFGKAIQDAGLSPSALAIEADGRLHRFDAAGDKKGDRTGWYVLHLDGVPGGAFGCWRLPDDKQTWSALPSQDMTPEERTAQREHLRIAREAAARERQRLADEAADNAARLWDECTPALEDNAYLIRKKVLPLNARQQGEVLVVPMYNASGQLRGLQRIFPDGGKRFTADMFTTGCFHWIEGNHEPVYICEGYATGVSINMATGNAVAVAFNAGNLEPTAKSVRENLPQAALTIAADNDRWTKKTNGTPWNTGREKAQQAAQAVGATVVWPEFRDLSSRPTDFNDLHVLEGLPEVRQQCAPSGGPQIAEWSMDCFAGPPAAIKWLVHGMIPLGCPAVLAAQGGVGKGMLTLDLGLTIAGAPPGIDFNGSTAWLGSTVDARGAAVIITAEDNRASVHQRLQALDPDGSRRAAANGRLFIVPLPNAGGLVQLVASEGVGKGFRTTEAYEALRRQLRRIPDLRLVNFDPLASFVACDINKDPQAGQYVQGVLGALAQETGATVLIAHHMSKPQGTREWNAETARNSIRGTTALVDGVRVAVCIWPAPENTVNDVLKALDDDVPRNAVFEAAVCKSNAPSDQSVRTMVRGPDGLLRCRDEDIASLRLEHSVALGMLENAIARAAEQGRPFTANHGMGIYNRREELPEALRGAYGKRATIRSLVQELLEDKRVVKCTYRTSVARWLDVPGGEWAAGRGEFAPGWTGEDYD